MELRLLACLMCVLSMSVPGTTQTTNCISSTFGKHFVFGIVPPFATLLPTTITLTIISQEAGSFQLNIPFLRINKTYQITRDENIAVSKTLPKAGTFQEYRGAEITSNVSLSVLVTLYNPSYFGESYVILPTQNLGNMYIAASAKSYTSSYPGQLMIVATVNQTYVLIEHEGELLHVTLNALEVYQLLAAGINDLTGTFIQSTQPVALFTAVKMQLTVLDSIAAQMLPIRTFSNSYIVAPTIPQPFKIRVLSETDTVHLTIANLSSTLNITQSVVTDYYFNSEPVTITSDVPISVVQYMTKPPAMTIVPSVSQFTNDYKFYVPHIATGYTHHFSIIVPMDKAGGLLYNRFPFHLKSSQKVPAPFNNYVIVQMNITEEGYHTMSHQDSSVKFGLLVYGYATFGYSFYAGLNIDGNCSTENVPVTATTSPSPGTYTPTVAAPTHSSNNPQTTAKPVATTTFSSQTTYQPAPGTGQLCYSCDDMSHLQYCDKVIRCQENEQCFVNRYLKNGAVTFRSGCMQYETCHSHNSRTMTRADECVECCSGDGCNGKGCNDVGLPGLEYRGPVCFNCAHVGPPSECQNINICHLGERCIIEKFEWGTEFHYKLGCATSLCHIITNSAVALSPRVAPICQECCEQDLCNHACTSDEEIIVG